MLAYYVLTTSDPELRRIWTAQLPKDCELVTTHDDDDLAAQLIRLSALVWIKDAGDPRSTFPASELAVVIAVGEPHSLPFAAISEDPRTTLSMSYDESRTDIGKIIKMADDLAKQRALVWAHGTRQNRATDSAAPFSPTTSREGVDFGFIEVALDHLGNQAIVLDAFKRELRNRFRSSRVLVFVREGRHFLAEQENLICPATDQVPLWLGQHAAMVDADRMHTLQPVAGVMALRHRMSQWNARLIVPLDLDGRLGGWVALGPRADGRPYSPADCDNIIAYVHLLSRVIVKQLALTQAQAVQREVDCLRQHGPKLWVLGPNQVGLDALGVEAREVVNRVRKEGRRVDREFGLMRISAGPLPGDGGVWILSDSAGAAGTSLAHKLEEERYRILHDIGLILSHELSNALFSVSTFIQHVQANEQQKLEHKPHPLLAQVDVDMTRLKEIPRILDTLWEMSKSPTAEVNLSELLGSLANDFCGLIETDEQEITLWGHEAQIRQAISWLGNEIIARRTGPAGPGDRLRFSIQLRSRNTPEALVLITMSFPGLSLDDLKVGEPTNVGEYPTTPVYLAREIIRYHYGTIHVRQGMDGPELCISLQSRRNA